MVSILALLSSLVYFWIVCKPEWVSFKIPAFVKTNYKLPDLFLDFRTQWNPIAQSTSKKS